MRCLDLLQQPSAALLWPGHVGQPPQSHPFFKVATDNVKEPSVLMGYTEVNFIDFLNEQPLLFFGVDQSLISGSEIFRPVEDFTPYDREKIEAKNKLVMQKSLVARRRIEAGHIFEEQDLGCKRPALGLPPVWLDRIVGKRARRSLPVDHIITLSDVDW
jgi:hypothetical protein